jgi:hypothetical protein
MLPRGLEDIAQRDQVAFGVGVRRFERVPHAGLRGQMRHHRGLYVGEKPLGGRTIGQVDSLEPEPTLAFQLPKAGFLQARVVIRIDAVHPHDRMAVTQQPPTHVEAHEAGGTRDQDRGRGNGHALLVMSLRVAAGGGAEINDSRARMTRQHHGVSDEGLRGTRWADCGLSLRRAEEA